MHGISIYFFSDNRTSVRFALILFFFLTTCSLGPCLSFSLSPAWTTLCHPIISSNYSVSGSRFLVFSSIGSSQATTLFFSLFTPPSSFPVVVHGCRRQSGSQSIRRRRYYSKNQHHHQCFGTTIIKQLLNLSYAYIWHAMVPLMKERSQVALTDAQEKEDASC